MTHTVKGSVAAVTKNLMYSPASLHLASLPLKWHDPQVCAIQCLSDSIHRTVTTHVLTKEETSLPLKETLLSSLMDRCLDESCWGWVEFTETLS